MLKQSVAVIAAILALSLLLTSCKKDGGTFLSPGPISVEDYIANLPDRKLKAIKQQTDLLRHPLKDAIERFGNDYELSWDVVRAKLSYKDIGCSFVVYVGEEFAHTEPYTPTLTFEDCNVIEYLSYLMIESVIFDSKEATLTDKITIGMTADEICKKIRAEKIEYSESNAYITEEYNESGEKVKVYSISEFVGDNTYIVVFKGDVLSSVELVLNSAYITPEGKNPQNGRKLIAEAFSYITEHQQGEFNIDHLSYKGELYSPYYDSWFYGWEFTEGDYEEFELCVEKEAPHRIYINRELSNQPILFWADGKFVSPMLSFLGKWREHDSMEYIDIKSVSKEGIVVFDMNIEVDSMTGEMHLLKNLNAAIDEIPQTLHEFICAEYNDEALGGEIQVFDGYVHSGSYAYAGQKIYLCDSILMDFNGSVQYLPRGHGGRVGAGPLTFHIPNRSVSYEQTSSHGYMENFGRDDPNKDNRLTTGNKTGAALLNTYLNRIYETSGLKYSELEYKYLYDYAFPLNNVTYGVWESVKDETPHYLYVDASNKIILKEVSLGIYSRYSKSLVYKGNSTVSGKSYANQKFVSNDGKITADLANRVITKTDAFVTSFELPGLHFDTVGENERFMFFTEIGTKFALNGYVLFDHTTWGATLHITDSNVPDFDIGVYYLDSESFFLDPSIGVVSIPESAEKDKYLDNKLNDAPTETKQVIRNFSGQIIGYIYVNEQGKKTVKDFSGKILGYYKPDSNVTTDFSGKIVARGDAASALLFGKLG